MSQFEQQVWRSARRTRICLLTEIPAPFRIPLFNALGAEPGIDLDVLFLAHRDPKRPYADHVDEFAFEGHVLKGREVVWRGRWIVWNRRVGRVLANHRPDVVIAGGWNQPAFWRALLFTRLRRLPVVAWVESTDRDDRPGGRGFELAKRLFLRACSGFIVPGRASRSYLHGLGVLDDRIVHAPNAVDAVVFGERVAELKRDREALRRRLGLDSCTFLYIGRFDPEKGLDTLLEAFTTVPGQLVFIGSGTQRAMLEDAVRRSGRIRVVDQLGRDELPAWYAAADVFVLPSRSEQWGMVLNEAAMSSLPIVATEAAGAAHELVEHGVSGFRVGVDDAAALGDALRRLAADPAFRERAGRRSRELVEPFTAAAWATAVAEFAEQLVTTKSGFRSPFDGGR
jgi:glycosyltransferase involved in cell wall biosynthesis